METKFCEHCDGIFTIDHFYKEKIRKGTDIYIKYICSIKAIKRSKEYYYTKREEIIKKHIIWGRENKEKRKQYGKKYYEKNKEYHSKRSLKWAEENKDKVAKISKRYYEKMPIHYLQVLLKKKGIQPTSELIDIQKNIIILKRKTKQIS